MTEDDKKKVNFLALLFNFVKELKDSKQVSTRLASLIENALQHRSQRWPMSKGENEARKAPAPEPPRDTRNGRDRDDYDGDYRAKGGDKYGGGRDRDRDRKGGKGGYDRDSNYGGRDRDRDEYAPKEEPKKTASPSRPTPATTQTTPAVSGSNADSEVKSIFERNKTEENLDVYIDLFKSDNPDLNCAPEDVLKAFLSHFANGAAKIAEVRAKVISSLIKSFKLSEKAFFSVFAPYLIKASTEDIPILKKVLGKIVASVLKEGFDLNNLELKYSEDADEKENQMYFNSDVLDEAAKDVKDDDPKYAAAIKSFKDKHLKL
jgi:hypothetical protein